jgi:hypothetical protein
MVSECQAALATSVLHVWRYVWKGWMSSIGLVGHSSFGVIGFLQRYTHTTTRFMSNIRWFLDTPGILEKAFGWETQ